MLPKELWELLLKHDVYVLACGDPFQLPPIDKNQDNHVLDTPHIFLNEVMRQAAESDIIKMTMDIRKGIKPVPRKGNDIHIIKEKDIVDGMYFWADQIIVGTNNKRHEINNYMREAYEMGEEPADGDKIICLRNCWETLSSEGNPLVNGTIGILRNPRTERRVYKTYQNVYPTIVLIADIEIGNEIYKDVVMDYKALKTGKKTFTPEQEYQISKRSEYEAPIEFNYGYAITCHRAQGSQWDKVLVVEERFPFEPTEHARWLYTACTRPESKLVLVT
jgi:exodeoxyribonuclease-5